MSHTDIEIRTDADVALADALVHVPGLRTGIFDAVPRPDRPRIRA